MASSGLRLKTSPRTGTRIDTVKFLPSCGMMWWFARLLRAGQGPRSSPGPGGAQFVKLTKACARPLRASSEKSLMVCILQ